MMNKSQTQTAANSAGKIQESTSAILQSTSAAPHSASSSSESGDVETIPNTVELSESLTSAKADEGEKKSGNTGSW